MTSTKNERGKCDYKRENKRESEEGEEIEREENGEIEYRRGDVTGSDWMRKREVDRERERTREIGRSRERERGRTVGYKIHVLD